MKLSLAFVTGVWTIAIAGSVLAATISGGTVKHYDQTIYVRNLSTLVSDKEVKDALPAIQAAVDKDFAPLWHTTAKLVFSAAPPQGSEFFLLLNRGKYRDALAFHRLQQGAPGSVIYVGVCKLYGFSWTVAFTHELWEQLADPSLIRTAQGSDGRIWANEIADPVEADGDGYNRAGAHGTTWRISDFITDKWYGAVTSGPYDFTGHVQKPFVVRPGGYAQWWDSSGWHIIENWRNKQDASWAREDEK